MFKKLWAIWVLWFNDRCMSCGNNLYTDKGRYVECSACRIQEWKLTQPKILEKQAILEKKVTRAKEILFGN